MKNRLALAFVALCLTPAASPAADQPPAAPLYRPAPFIPRQAVEWTGLYFGVNAGYGWGQTSTNTSFTGDAPGFQRAGALGVTGSFTTPQGGDPTELSGTSLGGSGTASGAIAGGQIGFNWQAGWAVFGAEFDAQWSGQRTSLAVACSPDCTATDAVKIKSLLTGRARFGVAFDWILPYVTAGAVLANASDDLTVTVGGVTGTFATQSGSVLGWTVGAGVDVALTSNWSARLEYLYVNVEDIGTSTRIPNVLGVGFTNTGIDVRDNIVRVGLNYRFGPRGGPGVLEGPRAAPVGYASAYDFVPAMATFADNLRIDKRLQAAPAVAETAAAAPAPPRAAAASPAEPKAAAPARVEVATAGELPAMPAAVMTEPRPATAPAIAAEPKPTKSPYKNFADIDDADLNDRVSAAPKAIALPSKKQRQNVENESQRLKSIMSICSGC